jgi:hypothetical protein
VRAVVAEQDRHHLSIAWYRNDKFAVSIVQDGWSLKTIFFLYGTTAQIGASFTSTTGMVNICLQWMQLQIYKMT